MMSVYCAAIDCRYNGNKGRCTAKSIRLNDNIVHTLYDGVQRFNKCLMYVESDEYKDIRKKFGPVLNDMMEKVKEEKLK